MSDTPKTDAAEELLYSLSWDTDVDGYDREQLDPVSAVRSEKVRELERENAALRELTSTLGAPNHINIPIEQWRELRADKERLDYMEKNVDFVSWLFYGKPHSWDFRAKIDAKRKEAQP